MGGQWSQPQRIAATVMKEFTPVLPALCWGCIKDPAILLALQAAYCNRWDCPRAGTAKVIGVPHMKEDVLVLSIKPANALLRVCSYGMKAC